MISFNVIYFIGKIIRFMIEIILKSHLLVQKYFKINLFRCF